jgi:hypothetical protein
MNTILTNFIYIRLSGGNLGLLPWGKAAGTWSWPFITIQCRGQQLWSYFSTPPWRGAWFIKYRDNFTSLAYFRYFQTGSSGTINLILSLTQPEPHRKRLLWKFFYCRMCILCSCNLCIDLLPSNDRGFLPSHCQATICGYTYRCRLIVGIYEVCSSDTQMPSYTYHV